MIFFQRVMNSVAVGLFMTGLLLVPFVGPFTVGLLLIPLDLVPFEFVHECSKTGDQVEIGFGWITFHTLRPFFLYWWYYACVAFIYLSLRKRLRSA